MRRLNTREEWCEAIASDVAKGWLGMLLLADFLRPTHSIFWKGGA